MPRWIGLVLALVVLAGLAMAPDWRAIGVLFAAHWMGLIPVAVLRFVPIAAAAEGWRLLFLGKIRRDWRFCFSLMWLREAINGLLPAARVGGEIASVVLLRRHGLSASAAVAVTLAETFVSIMALALFVMTGLGWLSVAYGGIAPVWIITGGLSMIGLFGFLLLSAPRLRLLGRALDMAHGLLPKGRGNDWQREAAAVERWLIWYTHRKALLLGCWIWQFIGWSLGAVELYCAAHILGLSLPLLEAGMFEAAIQAAANAGFFLPAALGAQEAAFVGAGMALGLSPEAGVALALARRGRDLLIYAPVVLRWSARMAAETS